MLAGPKSQNLSTCNSSTVQDISLYRLAEIIQLDPPQEWEIASVKQHLTCPTELAVSYQLDTRRSIKQPYQFDVVMNILRETEDKVELSELDSRGRKTKTFRGPNVSRLFVMCTEVTSPQTLIELSNRNVIDSDRDVPEERYAEVLSIPCMGWRLKDVVNEADGSGDILLRLNSHPKYGHYSFIVWPNIDKRVPVNAELDIVDRHGVELQNFKGRRVRDLFPRVARMLTASYHSTTESDLYFPDATFRV